MEVYDKIYKKDGRRRFLKSWLKNKQFKSWLRKVSSNETLFHCTICNSNLSCKTFTNIKKHAKSTRHKINTEKKKKDRFDKNNKKGNTKNDVVSKKDNDKNNVTSKKDNDKNNVVSKNKSDWRNWRTRPFVQQWLDIKELKPWLRESPYGNSSFFCAICEKAFAGGLSQIYRHAHSKTHKDKLESTQTSESNEELDMETDESSLPFEERKKAAEIRFAAFIADREISHETAEMILNFFQDVGKNPDVLGSINIAGSSSCNNT